MSKNKAFILVVFLFSMSFFASAGFFLIGKNDVEHSVPHISAGIPSPSPSLQPLPERKVLPNNYHIFQSFNNCGPAALSMGLSYYGINVSQDELGQSLRPYQPASGINDDKSVTLEELAEKSKEYGFIPFHRPVGTADQVKQFIANDMPVISRTWTRPNEDIGHYRVIKGYDNSKGTFIQDDSLQGKNLSYSYSDFNEIWKKFNYEYLVLVPREKEDLAKRILGENADSKRSWQNAVKNAKKELSSNPDDVYARFNLSVALFNIGDYQGSVREFERVESQLSSRTLWYQIEPIEAYYQLGNYDRVMEISTKILNNQNLAFSELYILRGKIYQKQGNNELARSEFQKAVLYNENLTVAKEALESLST